MILDQTIFTFYYILNLVIFAIVLGYAGITVSKLRKTSATYNARLLPFAYFSLISWMLCAFQYVILTASPFTSSRNDFSQNLGLWLGVMQTALWVSAVLSLHSKQFPRMALPKSVLTMFPVVIASVASCTLTSPIFIYFDAVAASAIFTTFAYSILQWRLRKIFAATFFIHGVSQWIWRFLWFTPLANTHIGILLGFPLWHIALLFAWFRLISTILQRAEPSHRKAVRDIERLELLNPVSPFGVMISSTVEDLAAEREAADRAIQGLKLNRFRAETFGSLSFPPLAVCAFLAQQCDIFILIIGERYGYVIESQGISVVEFEYKVARQQNSKKILVYVKETVEREAREKEFLQHVQHFERGYFTSKFTTPEDLYEGIQRDVSRWLTSHVNPERPKEE